MGKHWQLPNNENENFHDMVRTVIEEENNGNVKSVVETISVNTGKNVWIV